MRLIDADAAIERTKKIPDLSPYAYCSFLDMLNKLPTVRQSIYGYDIEHLKLIAEILQKENLPPERVEEALTDIGRIVAIVRDEFGENLKKAIGQIAEGKLK